MKKRFLSMILAVVLCGLLLAGCDGGGSTGTVPPAPEAPAVSAGVVSIKLLGASWEKKMDGYTYVYYSAELSNGNSKTAGACQITVTSRDAEGHVLDVSNGYTGRIAGNDTIRFSGGVMYVGDVPSAVELAVGTPWVDTMIISMQLQRHPISSSRMWHVWTNQKFPAMLSTTALLIVPMSVSL